MKKKKNSQEGKIENHRKMTSKQSIKEDNLTRRQEDGLTERRNHRNLTSLEADITKIRPYKKTGRRPNWKMTLACLASQSCTELGPAQPQLVQNFFQNETP